MAGSINGIGGQAFPLSQPYQPGKNDTTVRDQDKAVQKDTSAVAKSAYSNASNVQTRDAKQEQAASSARSERSDSSDTAQKRGTNVDISV